MSTLFRNRLAQYLLAHWMALWAPEYGINEQALAPYWTDTKRVEYPCGPCQDCKEITRDTSESYVKLCVCWSLPHAYLFFPSRTYPILRYRDPEGPLGSASDIRAFALEALPATHEALAAAPAWSRAGKGVVSILNLAGDDKAGTVLFGKCNVASEVCTIEKDGSNAVSVPSVSVDQFRIDHNIGTGQWQGALSLVLTRFIFSHFFPFPFDAILLFQVTFLCSQSTPKVTTLLF